MALLASFSETQARADADPDSHGHGSTTPPARTGGRVSIAPWADPTPEHPCGTILLADQDGSREGKRGLVIHEWDLAADTVLRTVTVAPASEYRDVIMVRAGQEVHLVVAFAASFKPIRHYVLDASLHVIRQHEVGEGLGQSIVIEDGVVAISWLGVRGRQARVHIATFSQATMQPLGAVDLPAGDGYLTFHPGAASTVPLLLQHGRLYALRSRDEPVRVVAYDPLTFAELASWKSPEDYVTLGRAHGHVAVLTELALTELSDALNVVSTHAAPGDSMRAFVEDPDTGIVVTAAGEALLADGTYRRLFRPVTRDQILDFHGRVITQYADDLAGDLGWFNLRRVLTSPP